MTEPEQISLQSAILILQIAFPKRYFESIDELVPEFACYDEETQKRILQSVLVLLHSRKET